MKVGDNEPEPDVYASAQEEFVVIKDALQNVKLPNDLKVDESRQGIQRKDQSRMNILGKCAKSAETSVKLLSTLKAGSVTEADLRDLTAISVAQIRYLQEEHSLLVVNSTFGEGVEKLYKGFKRRDIDVDALQASVLLHNQVESNRQNPRGNTRGRPRGAYGGYPSYRGAFSGGRGRGYDYHGGSSAFNNNFTQQMGQRVQNRQFNEDT